MMITMMIIRFTLAVRLIGWLAGWLELANGRIVLYGLCRLCLSEDRFCWLFDCSVCACNGDERQSYLSLISYPLPLSHN